MQYLFPSPTAFTNYLSQEQIDFGDNSQNKAVNHTKIARVVGTIERSVLPDGVSVERPVDESRQVMIFYIQILSIFQKEDSRYSLRFKGSSMLGMRS